MQLEKRKDGRESALGKVDEGRRAALRTIAATTAFIVPMVASFSTDGLRFNAAEAGGNHGGNATRPPPKHGKDGFIHKCFKFFTNWSRHFR